MAKIGKCQELRNPSKWSCCLKRHILGYHNSWTIKKKTDSEIHMKRSCLWWVTSFLKLEDQNQLRQLRFSVLISSLPAKFNVWMTKGRHKLCAWSNSHPGHVSKEWIWDAMLWSHTPERAWRGRQIVSISMVNVCYHSTRYFPNSLNDASSDAANSSMDLKLAAPRRANPTLRPTNPWRTSAVENMWGLYGNVVIVMPFTCHSARHMMELQATSARTIGIFRPDDTPYQSKTKNMIEQVGAQLRQKKGLWNKWPNGMCVCQHDTCAATTLRV